MAAQQPDQLSQLSDQLADAVQVASAALVRVQARRGPPASGIAFASDLVLTADHVVDPQREDRIRVGLPDGREVAATLAGRDPATDVAVLRVPEAPLTPATAGQAARVGALALAVARPGDQPSASLALVAGLGGPARTRRGGMLERFLLVDTVMYPGFSGGALVDTRGGVLGLLTSGLNVGGPSVAIPWDLATGLASTLAQHGTVARGYLGIGSQPVELSAQGRELAGEQQTRGLLVVHVADDGPAAQAGVLQGDILVRLDGQPVRDADDLQAMLGPNRVGATLAASVIRGGALQELRITVGTRA